MREGELMGIAFGTLIRWTTEKKVRYCTTFWLFWWKALLTIVDLEDFIRAITTPQTI